MTTPGPQKEPGLEVESWDNLENIRRNASYKNEVHITVDDGVYWLSDPEVIPPMDERTHAIATALIELAAKRLKRIGENLDV